MPITDIDTLQSAGIPLTKEVLKYANAATVGGKIITGNPINYNLNYDSLFAIMKEQNRIETIERYQWVNVPFGLTADIIERLLYYRGRGVFYFNKDVGKFQFLPYAPYKIMDEYGRFTTCDSLQFTGTSETQKDGGIGKHKKPVNAVKEKISLVYDLPYSAEMLRAAKGKETIGIILNDSTVQTSQQPIIRANYVEPVCRMMATLIQIINTAMFGAADHSFVEVGDEGELESFNAQVAAINQDILRGKRFTAVIGKFPITPLKSSNTADLEGLFNTFNSLTNFLKSITGVANPGVFDKKAHLLQEEQKLNGSNADDIYYNGLRMRQEFCLMVQAYYGYPIWCDSKRCMTEEEEMDMAMGMMSDPEVATSVAQTGGNDDRNTDVSK